MILFRQASKFLFLFFQIIKYDWVLQGMISLTLTSTIQSLRPQPCDHNNAIIPCSSSPSKLQYSILYLSLILAALGAGGSRYTTATLGANQHDNLKDQNIFFNWFFVTLYGAFLVSSTAIVYIQDNISWGWGFGISLASNAIGLAIFLLGTRFYRLDKPRGSPFTTLARVLVAASRKRLTTPLSTTAGNDDGYYYGEEHHVGKVVVDGVLTKSFRYVKASITLLFFFIWIVGLVYKKNNNE